MSFSAQVKRELVEKMSDFPECRCALLCGLLDNNIRFFQHDNGIYVYFESPYPAEACYRLFKTLLPSYPEVRNRYGLNGMSYRSYEVFVPGAQKLHALEELLWGNRGPDVYSIGETARDVERSYLCGAFLSSGIVSEPMEKSNMDITCRTLACAEAIKLRLKLFDVDVSIRERKRSGMEPTYVCYLKNGEKIGDFLRVLGATQAILEWENARIIKDVRNNVNRRCNCDIANLSKLTKASMEQINAIHKLQDAGQFDSLEASIREIALLRLEYPESSVTDLGAMANPPLSKSGVYHRIEKIMEIANQ